MEKALELDSENINSIIKRATLFMENGQMEKAMEQFNRAEKIAPTHPDVHYHRY